MVLEELNLRLPSRASLVFDDYCSALAHCGISTTHDWRWRMLGHTESFVSCDNYGLRVTAYGNGRRA
jgi:hypothetical protein